MKLFWPWDALCHHLHPLCMFIRARADDCDDPPTVAATLPGSVPAPWLNTVSLRFHGLATINASCLRCSASVLDLEYSSRQECRVVLVADDLLPDLEDIAVIGVERGPERAAVLDVDLLQCHD